MALTHVNHWDASGTGLTTLTVSPATIGNVVMFTVSQNGSVGDSLIQTISCPKVTRWKRVVIETGNPLGPYQVELWYGTVLTTGSTTITLTYVNVTTLTCTLAADEFTAGLGQFCVWSSNPAASYGGQSISTPTSFVGPTLTSDTKAANEFYYGFTAFSAISGSATGISSGFTVGNIGTGTNPRCAYSYDMSLAVTTAYTPTGTYSTGADYTSVGVIMQAATSAVPTFSFKFSPTTNPLSTPTYVDISQYVLAFTSKRGRQFELNRMEAGTGTITLDNSTRVFDPTNVNSPFYPNILPLKKFQLTATLFSTTYYIFTGYFESWPMVWENPNWAEVDCTLVDGFEALSNADVVSTAASLTTTQGSNKDITFTEITAGPGGNSVSIQYVVSGTLTAYSCVVTGVNIVINQQTDGSGNPVSTANSLIAAINADPIASGLVVATNAPGSSGVGIPGAMGQTFLSGGTFIEELPGARIGHVLDSISWPSADRVLDPGHLEMIAITFIQSDSEKALSHINDVENSELGYVFMDVQGRAAFHDAEHRFTTQLSRVSQATFGDDTALTELEYIELTPSFDQLYIYNTVSVTPANTSIAQTVSDATSIGQYMERDYSVSTQLVTSTDALSLAQWILLLYKQPSLRFASMTVQPIADAELWTQVLTREIGDQITVNRRPPDYSTDTKTVLSQNVYVESIAWTINPGQDATVQYLLSPVPPFNVFQLDDTTFGTLDSGNVLGF